jgi:hypothetical protein
MTSSLSPRHVVLVLVLLLLLLLLFLDMAVVSV